jgi:hypothetical protein
MSKKKTVVEKYEGLLTKYKLDDGDKAFIEERIAITKKKNASGKNAEPTPKQKEKMAEYSLMENAIVNAMEQGKAYTPTDLLKVIEGLPDGYNTQRLTPRLTALVMANRLTKETVKGRNVYSLPKAE